MMIRVACLSVLVATAAVTQNVPTVRGTYVRSEHLGVSFWVPRRLEQVDREDAKALSYTRARSHGGVTALFIKQVDVQRGPDTASAFIDYWKNNSRRQFKAVSFEVVEGLEMGGRKAAALHHKDVDSTGQEHYAEGDEVGGYHLCR